MQKNVFLNSEGDAWFERNFSSSTGKEKSENDNILEIIREYNINPKNILEVGCSDGWRLKLFREEFKCGCYGIEPSEKAVEKSKNISNNIEVVQGTADSLPYEDNTFDVLVYGFCLYLCDREDLFKIAYEGDRVLKDGGYIIIQDFSPPQPYRNQYIHKNDVFSYKMQYSEMFLWNPIYYKISSKVFTHSGIEKIEIPDERVSIELLQKNAKYAYPSVQY